MKRKITILIAMIAAIMLIAQPVKVMGQANVYASNVTITNGSNTSDCSVVISSNSYSGHKLGTSSKTGSITFSVPAGTSKLLVHAAGWKDKSSKITPSTDVTGVTISPSSAWSLTADAGIHDSSPFTLSSPSSASTDYYNVYTLTGISSSAEIKISSSSERAIVWGVNAAVTVTFNGNGGSTAAKATSYTQDVLYNTATALTTNLFTRDGFNFTGWNTQEDGEGTHYNAGASVTRTSDLTLYAEWVAIGSDPSCSFDETSHNFGNVAVSESASHTFTVSTANLEGDLTVGISGTGYSVEPSTILQAATSTEVTVTFSPTVAGAAAGTVTISGGGLASSATATLSGTGAYKVTYDANGGTGTLTDSNNPYTSGATVTVLDNTFTWFGHTFTKWNTQADGNGTSYDPDETFEIEGNTILYAIWDVKPTYSLVTDVADIVPGAHYVIASNIEAGSAFAIGSQNDGQYRNRVGVTIVDNSGIKSIEQVANLYEFVLCGYENNWTFYDKTNTGYLYAAGSGKGNNYLNYQTTNDNNGLWSISIADETYVASIVAQGSNTNNKIQHNNGATRFSCYSSNQGNVYLYMRDDDTNLEFYSDTKINTDITVSDDITLTYAMTINNSGVLNMGTHELEIGSGGSLTIEDGGQLILAKTNTGVAATVKKNVSAATAASKTDATYWYAISAGVANPSIEDNTNLITEASAPYHYDLYRFNEEKNAGNAWENYRNDAYDDFDELTKGRGYLYRNASDLTITMTGDINVEDFTYNVTKTGSGEYAGFNLIGNPYTHNIYKGAGTAITSGTSTLSTGFYYLEPSTGKWAKGTDQSTAIAPNQGILVQVNETGNIKMTNTNSNGVAKSNNDYIMLSVANSQYSDEAYAWFDEGIGLNKIEHRNSEIPMLYINQNGENFAIATMSDETQSFNLNFKATTMGKYTLSYETKGEYNYLHVIDRLTGEDVDMLLDGEYSFIGAPNDNDNRFIVKLSYNANSNATDNDIFAYQSGSDIIVNGEGELQIFDVTGRKVATQHVNGVETINVQLQGVYIFKLNEKVQKIVVR